MFHWQSSQLEVARQLDPRVPLESFVIYLDFCFGWRDRWGVNCVGYPFVGHPCRDRKYLGLLHFGGVLFLGEVDRLDLLFVLIVDGRGEYIDLVNRRIVLLLL